MPTQMTRRETLIRGLAATSLLSLVPDWATPALAQGENEVPFTDIPKTFNPAPPGSATRLLDIRKIEGHVTPKDQFFAVQHFAQPDVDPTAYRLKLTGMVNKPGEITLADLRAMKPVDIAAGYECSGNRGASMQGLASSGKWTGVPVNALLKHAGVHPQASEVVFFGLDHGTQEVAFRTQTYKLDQQFGRSISIQKAMQPEPLLAYALNGEPLTKAQGSPLRVIIPGWYGVANVKWVSEIHVQDQRYMGNYEARWYRTIRGVGGTAEDGDMETQWVESEVTHMNIKSVIARVSKKGSAYQVLGFVLNDGAPVKSVEVKVDDGPWQQATVDASGGKYAWKLFTMKWEGAAPGEHTLVARATDANGVVQPEAAVLNKWKKTMLEDNSQFPRKVMIS
jgi:DMSO/TMAO reductase YedYZ molybdopterin-dependent catalytic subunit